MNHTDDIMKQVEDAIGATFPDPAVKQVARGLTDSWSEGYDAGYTKGVKDAGCRVKVSNDCIANVPAFALARMAQGLGMDLVPDADTGEYWLVRRG
jgi:hypothetical protein